MEETKFKTLLNNDHKLRGNEFVEGKLLGMADIICNLQGETREVETKNGEIKKFTTYRGVYWRNRDGSKKWLEIICTREQYEQFKECVEERYPGLCTFYYEN